MPTPTPTTLTTLRRELARNPRMGPQRRASLLHRIRKLEAAERHDLQAMEQRALAVYGAKWKGLLGPRQTQVGYAGRTVVLQVQDVMAGCREWFLAHVDGHGWSARTITLSGMGTDVMAAAVRRIENREWWLCPACNLPVFPREYAVQGMAHWECAEAVESSDTSVPHACPAAA
jgi:hypothetical protein